jgi:hypothetical protein
VDAAASQQTGTFPAIRGGLGGGRGIWKAD